MISYDVSHETLYDYAEEVVTSHNELRLMPRSTPRQRLAKLELRIEPTPDTVKWHKDYFGNDVVFFALHEPHERLRVATRSLVELAREEPPDPTRSPAWEEVARRVRVAREPETLAALEYVFGSRYVEPSEELARYAAPSFEAGRPFAAAVLDFSRRIHADFRYDTEATGLDTPLAEVLREKHGVCQDFSHVLIGGLRSLGLPARYVSGYLRTRREAGGPPDAAEARTLVGAEASHAWVAAFCPVLGWIETDPTNDLVPTDRHVTLAFGRDYEDVSPVKGMTLGGGSHRVSVAVRVRPLA